VLRDPAATVLVKGDRIVGVEPARYGPGMPDCLLPLTAARLDNVNGLWGSGVDPVYFTTSCRKCGGRRWVRG
jgi:hypothetical protein